MIITDILLVKKAKSKRHAIDGGPTKNTIKILNLLRKEDIKATFFITGENELIALKLMLDDGHTMGIQSYAQDYKRIYGNDLAFVEDLNKIYDHAKKMNVGEPPKFMRFYGGSDNTITKFENPGGITRAAEVVSLLGLEIIDWNVDSGDDKNKSVDEIVENVLNGAKDKNDICVLLHDGRYDDDTVEALPRIIKSLKDDGYRFKAINEFTNRFQHRILN